MKFLTLSLRTGSRILLLLGCLSMSFNAVQAQTTDQVPTEVPADVPAETSTDISTDISAEAPTEAPADTVNEPSPTEAAPEAPAAETPTSEAPTDTTLEESDPLEQLPPAPEAKSTDAKSQSANLSQKPAIAPAMTRPTVPSTVPSDWEILSEPAKLPGTSVPPVLAPPSPFSSEPLSAIARTRKLALPLKDARVVILKSRRRLDLYSGNTLVKSYPVSLGRNPNGHKQKQGDGRTPEGRYFICTRNSTNSAFHIFLGLSYPAVPDAKRAVNNKQITWREYQLINQRLASRSAPLWETRLGGWVGIHGGTDDSFAQSKMRARGTRDWTAGCIALTDRQIEEIHAATKLGTPVDIRP